MDPTRNRNVIKTLFERKNIDQYNKFLKNYEYPEKLFITIYVLF